MSPLFLYNEMKGGVNMRFYCHAYPNALIQGVRFTKGYAEATSTKDIEGLNNSPIVVQVKPDSPEEVKATEVISEKEPLIDYDELTITELKRFLTRQGIEFPSKARKDVLISLLREAE